MATTVTEVWQQVHDGLRWFIAKRVADPAQVEDILQEVFLRIHQRIDGLKDPRRVISWIYQITRHAVIDHYRTTGQRREVPAGLAADMETTGLATAAVSPNGGEDSGQVRRELAGCLRPMLNRLSPDYRDAIMLVELEGLTQQAAAERLGLSLSGMKSRVQRGRKQLRQMLDACCLIQLDRRGGVAEYERRPKGDALCGASPCHTP
ncbi:MAG: sigZ [Nitrospira sp.]|jgi:RNA polymerase sigma-70 factor (ECF subfamily)|nr:sigZ [Nitrospira sp.]